jgi:type IV secretory pathway TrbF-like protein
MANLLKSSTNIWATMKVLVIAFVVGVDFLGLSTNVNQPLILMFGIIK